MKKLENQNVMDINKDVNIVFLVYLKFGDHIIKQFCHVQLTQQNPH